MEVPVHRGLGQRSWGREDRKSPCFRQGPGACAGGRQPGNTRTALPLGCGEDAGCPWESALALPGSLVPQGLSH